MDVAAAARFQGPGLRAQALGASAVVVVGAGSIAVVRIVREGRLDGLSITLIVLAVAWAAGVVSLELLANKRVDRAAREHSKPSDRLVLFRYAQVGRAGTTAIKTLNKGWIATGERQLTITAFRRRQVIGRYATQDIVSAHAATHPKAYSVLVVAFTDGTKLEAIPVQTGIHNTGLSHQRVSEIASAIRSAQQQARPTPEAP